jgi:stringent starvation protein A
MAVNGQVTIFVAPNSSEADIIRAVLGIKGVECKIVEVGSAEQIERIRALTAYSDLPLLMDRDVTLTSLAIILDYLEDRYPAPSLMPLTPSTRANSRMCMSRLQRELFPAIERISAGEQAEVPGITETIAAFGNLFDHSQYFCSDALTFGDVVLTVLIHRASEAGIDVRCNRHLGAYFSRMSALPAFAFLVASNSSAA